MKPTYLLYLSCLIYLLSYCAPQDNTGEITCGSLIEELADLSRLTYLPEDGYSVVQYSSYDRRSSHPGNPGWFENSDGFGGEPIPGFIETISEPGEDGIGEYLICNVVGPGAIVRTWTARINGEISLYLDDMNEPFYEGSAEDFHWNTAGSLIGEPENKELESVFRQNDACYFPVPFQKGCRITWKGDLKLLHFYHIEIRSYFEGIAVKTFSKSDIETYKDEIDSIKNAFAGMKQINHSDLTESSSIQAGGRDTLYSLVGPGVITNFVLKVKGQNTARALRATVLKIYFDGASEPQINSPLGDFFGAAPGVNPFGSLPFTVSSTGEMECRFHMPFKKSAIIVAENHSGDQIDIISGISKVAYEWDDKRSLHFRAKWRMDKDLSASNTDIQDIPYLIVIGKGRFVGVSAFLKNPTDVPTSWGNWWGEGDEKIFVDNSSEPVFIGTGSEDYFNYSWSSAALFDYAYCGQPRNDGPANRGYVTNYRFQILDDIPFNESFAFYMELLHHGNVEGFDYARIAYYYANQSSIDDNMEISENDLAEQEMPLWEKPLGYLGSGGATFLEAEDVVSVYPADRLFPGYKWSGGRIFKYDFKAKDEKIYLRLNNMKSGDTSINLVTAHSSEGGKIRLFIDGYEEESAIEVNLKEDYLLTSRNHALRRFSLTEGNHRIVVQNLEDGPNRLGIDFIWYK